MEIIQKQAQKRGIVINMNLPITDRRVYYVFIIIGFIALLIVNILRRKRFNISLIESLYISFCVEIFAILGAILLYIFENLKNLTAIGFSFFGTVLFLPVFMFFVSLTLRKTKYFTIMNYIATTIPLELAIIRIGCALCGCCYGIMFPIGIHYGEATRFPVQLFESGLDIGIFVFLLINEKKKISNVNAYITFVFLYSIVRLLCEFFRDDTASNIWFLTNGQFFSIICLIFTIFYYKANKNKAIKHQ